MARTFDGSGAWSLWLGFGQNSMTDPLLTILCEYGTKGMAGNRTFATAAILVLAATTLAFAGEFNSTLNIGDPAPAWTNLPGVDGKEHSLADLKAKDVVVVVFTCN